MKRFNLFLILLFLFHTVIDAQTKPVSNNESEFIYSFVYDMCKSYFKKPKYDFVSEKFNPDKTYLKKKLKDEVILSAVDTLQKTATLGIQKESSGTDLNLRGRFPIAFKENDLNKIAKLDIVENKLYNSKQQKLEIRNFGVTGFGEFGPYHFVNGKRVDPAYLYATRQYRIGNSVRIDSLCTGSAIFEIELITDYSIHKFSKNDFSKSFRIDSVEYKIIDIYENKVVLEIRSDRKERYEISLINFDTNGNALVENPKPRPLNTQPRSNFTQADCAKLRMSTMKKEIFEFFKDNPNISMDDFKQKFSIDDLKNPNKSVYLILETAAPIQNDFIIYAPVFGLKKQFEVKLSMHTPKNKNE